MTHAAAIAVKPWYREPWPWILMSGPLAVVIAGGVTAYLAVVHEDALVADNYYKEGLAINRTLDQDQAAQRGGYQAQLMFSADGRNVRVHLVGKDQAVGVLTLRMAHSTRADLDVVVPLTALQAGWYEGKMQLPASPRWNLQLQDARGAWRLTGSWRPSEGPEARLGGNG